MLVEDIWENRRYEISKEVMASRVLGCQNTKVLDIEDIAKFSVKYADALIKELKKQ